jgi:hypothetical protein
VRDILGDVLSKQKVNADEKEKSEEEEKKKWEEARLNGLMDFKKFLQRSSIMKNRKQNKAKLQEKKRTNLRL